MLKKKSTIFIWLLHFQKNNTLHIINTNSTTNKILVLKIPQIFKNIIRLWHKKISHINY